MHIYFLGGAPLSLEMGWLVSFTLFNLILYFISSFFGRYGEPFRSSCFPTFQVSLDLHISTPIFFIRLIPSAMSYRIVALSCSWRFTTFIIFPPPCLPFPLLLFTNAPFFSSLRLMTHAHDRIITSTHQRHFPSNNHANNRT